MRSLEKSRYIANPKKNRQFSSKRINIESRQFKNNISRITISNNKKNKFFSKKRFAFSPKGNQIKELKERRPVSNQQTQFKLQSVKKLPNKSKAYKRLRKSKFEAFNEYSSMNMYTNPSKFMLPKGKPQYYSKKVYSSKLLSFQANKKTQKNKNSNFRKNQFNNKKINIRHPMYKNSKIIYFDKGKQKKNVSINPQQMFYSQPMFKTSEPIRSNTINDEKHLNSLKKNLPSFNHKKTLPKVSIEDSIQPKKNKTKKKSVSLADNYINFMSNNSNNKYQISYENNLIYKSPTSSIYSGYLTL